MDRTKPRSAMFGRVDPFCWLLVIPMLLLALVSVIMIDQLLGALIGVPAIVIALFDSWVNRPSRVEMREKR